jgi:hypothetical protein
MKWIRLKNTLIDVSTVMSIDKFIEPDPIEPFGICLEGHYRVFSVRYFDSETRDKDFEKISYELTNMGIADKNY